jgi:hypothetical protein
MKIKIRDDAQNENGERIFFTISLFGADQVGPQANQFLACICLAQSLVIMGFHHEIRRYYPG